MNRLPLPRVTPWVWRLMIANAVVLLLLMTLFPALVGSLQFDPRQAFTAPWTFVTYMFVHGGVLHLAVNMLFLFFLGSAVERRVGSRAFILYYLYCGLGGPFLALLVATLSIASPPFVGASGAILGVAVAFAMYWPDAEMLLFPIPIPIRARTLVIAMVAFDLVAEVTGWFPGVAHWAHLGGALFGFLYLRFQSYSRPVAIPRPPTRERVLVSRPDPAEMGSHGGQPARPRRRSEKDPVTAEIDRVLDKISATGMDSLTADERRFLDEVSRKKKDERSH